LHVKQLAVRVINHVVSLCCVGAFFVHVSKIAHCIYTCQLFTQKRLGRVA
jgi:hypothetical protein